MHLTISAAYAATNPTAFDDALKLLHRVPITPGDRRRLTLNSGAQLNTRGPWNFPETGFVMVPPDTDIDADGATITLAADAVRETNGALRPHRDIPLLTAAPGAAIRGGTWHGNYTALPDWNVDGFRFTGRFLVERVIMKGLRGYRGPDAPEKEVFAISSRGETSGSRVSKMIVDGCDPSHLGYTSGIYIGATVRPPSGSHASTVEDCDVRLGAFGQFAYSSTYATNFTRCKGVAQRFWYTDTGDGIAALRECSGKLEYAALGCVGSRHTEPVTRSVVAADCNFSVPAGRGIEWWDKDSTPQRGGVTFLGGHLDALWTGSIFAPNSTAMFLLAGTGLVKEFSTHRAPSSPEVVWIR